MGAFLLFRSDADIDLRQARHSFTAKGFELPQEFPLGNMHLWLFKKQFASQDNFVHDGAGNSMFVFGSLSYEGRSLADGLASLLTQFRSARMNQSRLHGAFCAIFHIDGKLSMLMDGFGVYRVYTDAQQSFFSSSFLAALSALRRRATLDKEALLEKCARGYLVGPRTLVKELKQLTLVTAAEFKNKDIQVIYPKTQASGEAATALEREDALRLQLNGLNDYFRRISAFLPEKRVDIGLSGGYDSRLLLMLAIAHFASLQAHTHWTGSEHDQNRAIAAELCEANRLELRVIKTAPAAHLDRESFEAMADSSLYYYDGNCAYTIGCFSQTHSREYRIAVLNGCQLGLNGIGGEIYRNHYRTRTGQTNFRLWIRNRTFYLNACRLIGEQRKINDLTDGIMERVFTLLGVPSKDMVSSTFLRRYFSEVRMPFCDGVVNHANQQIAFYFTPFTEPHNVRAAYRAHWFASKGDGFQIDLMKHIDPRTADIVSDRGFSPCAQPFGFRLSGIIKSHLPEYLIAWRRQLQSARGHGTAFGPLFSRLMKEMPLFRRAMEAVQDALPQLNWEVVQNDKAHVGNLFNTGHFLVRYQHKLHV